MTATSPAVLVRVGPDGTPFFEAKWRDADGNQLTRRLGRAWLEQGSEGGWVKRRGRTPPGWLDERSAHVAAAEKVAAVGGEREAAAEAARRAGVPTVRRVAHEWLTWKRDVKGGARSTLRENEILLREPGTAYKRGSGESKGRIMTRFGDRSIDAVTTRDVSTFLRELDRAGLSARNVNEHRAVLHAIFVYAMKPDTYALASNPVAATDKRYQSSPPPLDHYEVAELESLARACERGEHCTAPPSYRGRPNQLSDEEHAARVAEDCQDAELFRVAFYSGMRVGELVALRWRYVHFLPDLSGAIINVERAASAGVEKEPKGRRGRQVPIPRPAAEALARLGQREHFTDAEDYVFCNRLGRRLDPSAVRRRYKRAAEAAGLRPLKLHPLRHATGSVLARSLPLVTVRDVLGHAELRTTNRYLHSKIDAAAIVAGNVRRGRRSGRGGGGVDVDAEPMYCHSEYMSTIKEQRLQIRVDPQRKQLLERAADAAHQNLSAFVLGAASRRAEEVLAERTVVELSPHAAQAFSDALAQPARVNERLAVALDRPQRFRWVD